MLAAVTPRRPDVRIGEARPTIRVRRDRCVLARGSRRPAIQLLVRRLTATAGPELEGYDSPEWLAKKIVDWLGRH